MLTMSHRSRGPSQKRDCEAQKGQGQGGRVSTHTRGSRGTQKGRRSALIWLGSHTIREVQRNQPVRWGQVRELRCWGLSSVSRQWDNSKCFLVIELLRANPDHRYLMSHIPKADGAPFLDLQGCSFLRSGSKFLGPHQDRARASTAEGRKREEERKSWD